MADNWKTFQQINLEGGLANYPTQRVTYIDSHNGSDSTGDGSHDNPYQTIQAKIDNTPTADMVLAGYWV